MIAGEQKEEYKAQQTHTHSTTYLLLFVCSLPKSVCVFVFSICGAVLLFWLVVVVMKKKSASRSTHTHTSSSSSDF